MVIAREVWGVVQARRRGRAAARLHVRIVALFSVIAAVPAILVAVVASVTLDRGLDRLFSQQTQSLIENSLIVADAYVREQVQFVRADSIAIAIELARAKPLFDQSREQFHQFLAVQASIRGLPAIVLLDKDLNVVDEVETKVTQAFVKPSAEVLAGINETEPQVAMFLDANHVAVDHQAARLQRRLSVYRAAARPARARAIAGDAGERRAVRRSLGAPDRRFRSPSR